MGGGGGSSGEIIYPPWMQSRWTTLQTTVWNAYYSAVANNPYASAIVWDPSSTMTQAIWACDAADIYNMQLDAVALWTDSYDKTLATQMNSLESEAVNNYIDMQKNRLVEAVEEDILPKFKRGMQDVNAVHTSSFILGEAFIQARLLREVEALESNVKGQIALQAFAQAGQAALNVIQTETTKSTLKIESLHYRIEASRLLTVAVKEYQENVLLNNRQMAMWDLDLTRYLMDALGCIAGTGSTSVKDQAGPIASAMSGALSGAATGASIAAAGGPISAGAGMGIGAVVGGIAALF